MKTNTDHARQSGITNSILAERDYQDEKWGHDADDKINTPWMWASYISHYSTKWMDGTFGPLKSETVDDFRNKMIKTAAIAIAAIESLDRQREENGKAHYES